MGESTPPPEITAPASLEEILREMNQAGEFWAIVLASSDGLPIATVPNGHDSDVTAATVALLRKVSHEAQQQLGLAEVDEMTICSHHSVRLVCRYLDAGREGLILVVIAPPSQPYRRATNRAIRQIRQLLA